MKIYIYSFQGERDYNEDRYKVIGTTKDICCALYDGHGGDFVSGFLRKHFLQGLLPLKKERDITRYFRRVQSDLRNSFGEASEECGSTVLICRVRRDGSRRAQIINLGDCRIVACSDTEVHQLNTEHKPDTEDERARITSRGTPVDWDSEDGLFRVSGYSVSRSLGDTKYPALSQTPEVNRLQLSETTRFLVMGTDGLWDTLDNDQVAQIGRRFFSKQPSTSGTEDVELVRGMKKNVAYDLALKAHKNGSQDNITVIVISL